MKQGKQKKVNTLYPSFQQGKTEAQKLETGLRWCQSLCSRAFCSRGILTSANALALPSVPLPVWEGTAFPHFTCACQAEPVFPAGAGDAGQPLRHGSWRGRSRSWAPASPRAGQQGSSSFLLGAPSHTALPLSRAAPFQALRFWFKIQRVTVIKCWGHSCLGHHREARLWWRGISLRTS